MKLKRLYERVIETTGLDILTIGSLQTAISNCMADLTSRGYRLFKEITFDNIAQTDVVVNEVGYIEIKIPVSQVRKVLYTKIFLPQYGIVAKRYSLSNPNVQKNWYMNRFRSWIGSNRAIFYIKDDRLIIEYDLELGAIVNFKFGYYSNPCTNYNI